MCFKTTNNNGMMGFAVLVCAANVLGQNPRGLLPPQFPELTVTNAITTVSPGMEFIVNATVLNSGGGTANAASVELFVPAGYTINGPSQLPLPPIAAGQSGLISFSVDASCNGGLNSITTLVRNGVVEHDSTSTLFANNVTPLDNDQPEVTDEPEHRFSFETISNDWSVVAVQPLAGDRNLRISDLPCGRAPAWSNTSGSAVEFVVVDGHDVAPDTRYATVTGGEAGDDYRIETQRGIDVGLGSHSVTFSGVEIVELYEFNTVKGNRYRVSTSPAPFSDLVLATFGPDRVWGGRWNADTFADDGGLGVDESVEFFGAESGRTAIVLARQSGLPGTHDLDIEVICRCEFGGDPFEIDVLDLLAFLELWLADEPGADISTDGVVSIIDVLEFLDCWLVASQSGCF